MSYDREALLPAAGLAKGKANAVPDGAVRFEQQALHVLNTAIASKTGSGATLDC